MNGADDDPRDVDCGLNPAFDLPAPYSKLTPLEINTLVRISQFMSIKEIASADGVGAEAIIARINRARYKLDGMPRVKAAREVARLVQNSPSYNPVYIAHPIIRYIWFRH